MAKKRRKIRIFSALEVANICGVVNQTAINWIKNGYLQAFTTPGGQYRVYAENLYAFLNERSMKIPEELSALIREGDGERAIIIVDDDKDFNNMLKSYLQQKLPTAKILQAYNGFEAGRDIAEVKPSIVILDIDLPGLDGTQLCTQIKSDTSFGKPAVISVTGLNDSQVKKAVLDAGADDYLVKPVSQELLHIRLTIIERQIQQLEQRGEQGE